MGKYANQNVSKILSDLVIFLGGTECSITTKKGTLYYLFGLGYYYVKFELKSGRYIIDNRQLTGLVLADFVYDYMAKSRNITLDNDRDVIIGEKVIKVPINLSSKSNNKKTFIKGTLMRNVFIPYKDIFLEMMETIHNNESYKLEKNGHQLLSTQWDFYNKILISSEMNYEMKVKYINQTAGLNDIVLGANKLLNEYFSLKELQEIEKNIIYLKKNYATLEYDPMYLFSIIDNASKLLIFEQSHFPRDKNNNMLINMPKESILISAEKRMNSFVEWPEQFKRKTKEQLEMSIDQKEPVRNQDIKNFIKLEEIDDYVDKEKENFELRTMKSQFVESKLLPDPPKG
ncbi:MAG: hypothetical protein ACFFAN_18555, partial [Promethearchaeota archaeon]